MLLLVSICMSINTNCTYINKKCLKHKCSKDKLYYFIITLTETVLQVSNLIAFKGNTHIPLIGNLVIIQTLARNEHTINANCLTLYI